MKIKSFLLALLLSVNTFAQNVLMDAKVAFYPNYSAIYVDTGLTPNIFKIMAHNSTDSAVQLTTANQPRLVNLGVKKSLEFTRVNKDRLVTSNSLKTHLRGDFTFTFIAKPFDGIVTAQTVFGVIDGDQFFININADGKVQATMKVGTKTVNVKSQDTIFHNGEYFTPKMINWTYEDSIGGVGGFKLYCDGQLLALDATMNGNTSGFNNAAFDPASLGFGIGIRNRTTVDQAYGGVINAIIIHDKVISSSQIDSLYQFYTAPTQYSLYGLPGDTIGIWILAGQSNCEGSAPAIEFPVEYKGIQWGTHTGTDNTVPNIVSTTYSSGIWGFRYILFKDLADTLGRPVFHVMTAVGGSRLGYNASGADWNVASCAVNGSTKVLSQRLIDNSIAKTDACIVKINAMGYPEKIMGVIWIQGEADSNTLSYANDYGQNFKDLRDFYRAYYADSTLPFIIGRTHDNFVPPRPHNGLVRSWQEACSDTSTNCTLRDNYTYIYDTDTFSLGTDLIHWDGPGQKMNAGSCLKIIITKNLHK